MIDKLLFVHGYGTNSAEMSWMHHAANKLESRYESRIPSFPNSSKPIFFDWESKFFEEISDWVDTDKLTVVGHSLGASFIMMLANKLKFRRLIAVAPGYVGHISREEYYSRSARDLASKDRMYSFFEDGKKINPNSVEKNILEKVLIYSEDDLNIKPYTREFFENQIKWDGYIKLNGYGHFMAKGDNPINEFKELIDYL